MSLSYSMPLSKLVKEFNLGEYYLPMPAQNITITTADINRAGLELAGFFEHFDNKRIQIVGRNEIAYLESFTPDGVAERVDNFFSRQPKAVVITRGIPVPEDMLHYARKYGVPLLTTDEGTSAFMSGLIATLNVQLAPRVTRHGVLVEVYGEGILLLGESGVGKSETAVELVKRGHRLIADDAVEIKRVSNKSLVGSSPENIRHFVELRGIGIVNARKLFGVGSVNMTEKIDLIIQLEPWEQGRVYDRMGIEEQYTDILGLQVPSTTIPVKPGRNLAIIIEVAAMNNRQKKMGYNAGVELLRRLGMLEEEGPQDDDL